MKHSSSVLLAMGALAFLPETGFAWYGPICYPDRIAQVSLTLQSIVGETPGELKVSFDNNSGIVELDSVKASKTVPGAHEIILKRNAQSENGIVGVIATSPRSSVGFKFELEFRKNANECAGAILKVSASGDRNTESIAKAPAQRASSGKQVLKREKKSQAFPQKESDVKPVAVPAESIATESMIPPSPSVTVAPSETPAQEEVNADTEPAPEKEIAPAPEPSAEAAPVSDPQPDEASETAPVTEEEMTQ